MPAFHVYLEQDLHALGRTRTVLVPYDNNPVTAADEPAAIKQVAEAIVATIGKPETVEGVYVAAPSAVRKRVAFTHSAVLSDP